MLVLPACVFPDEGHSTGHVCCVHVVLVQLDEPISLLPAHTQFERLFQPDRRSRRKQEGEGLLALLLSAHPPRLVQIHPDHKNSTVTAQNTHTSSISFFVWSYGICQGKG